MAREKATEKALRLLGEGKVRITAIDEVTASPRVWATVIGDHDVYTVTRFEGRWFCDCPAMGPCSHAMAAARVVR